MRDGEALDGMLTHEIHTMLLAYKNRRKDTVLCFQGKYMFLSNFFVGTPFSWDGLSFQSAEAAFQSAK